MLKHRFFYYGLGWGLVVGSLLLQLFDATPAAGSLPLAEQAEEQTISDEASLKEAASRFGYQLIAEGEKMYTEAEMAGIRQQLTRQPGETEASQAKETRSFVITPGMSSEKVSEMLFALRLIDNRDQFMQTMTDRRLHKKIRTGTYTFTGNPSADEVIKRITEPPKE